MKRLEFTDIQKAQIYSRDKGLCAFSGKILWVFHYGASIHWDMDWVDHIKPAMKGGDNSIENGICASSFYNSKKKDNSHDNKYLFKDGKPTEYYYHAYGFISDELLMYLKSIENIHYTDWYINRAICSLMITITSLINPYDLKGNLMKRDSIYWAKSAFKKVKTWKTKSTGIDSFISRLSIDINTLSEDKKIILDITTVDNYEDVLNIAQKLVPYYSNSINLYKSLYSINNNNDYDILYKSLNDDLLLADRDKKILKHSIENFYIK